MTLKIFVIISFAVILGILWPLAKIEENYVDIGYIYRGEAVRRSKYRIEPPRTTQAHKKSRSRHSER